MKDLSPKFSIPIDMPRPRGSRLIEGFSPKLGRRLQFFDHATFAVWIALEATPDVITLCERPSRTGKDKGDPIVDFWVRRAVGEEFLFVPTGDTSVPRLDVCLNLPARTVTVSERAAQSTWTANWMRMLPVVNGPSVRFVSKPATSPQDASDMPKIASIRVFSHRNSLKHLNFKRFRRFPPM